MEATANIRIPFSGWSYVRPLGSGGFGSVCEIQRDLLGTTEKSAMKMISIPKDTSAIDADRSDGYDEVSIRRKYEDCLNDMVAEYKLMQQLQGNSNIVDCKDIYYERQENGVGWNVYVRMELLTPLKDLTNAGDLPEETVVVLGKDICRALAACQERNIVHRDIKPENIMASPFGFKLGDFGIARTLDHTTNASITGTERYIAPEVMKREKYGREVDIYSLGLVLYWLLNNRRMPFWPQGNTPPRASEIADAQNKRIHGVPLPAPVHGSPALKQIVLKACAYDPKERYGSAKEMLTALEDLTNEALEDLTNGTMPTAEHSAAAASAGGSFGSGTIGGEYGRNSIGTGPVYDRSFESGSESTAGNGWRNGETIGDPNLRKQNRGPSGPAAGCNETVDKVLSAGGGNSDQQRITVRNNKNNKLTKEISGMNFGQAIASFFKNYVNFKDRARRSEFWFAQLFTSLVGLAVCWIPVVDVIWGVAILIPNLAIMVRRLHDIGKHWYWLFMYCIPFAGIVFMFMYTCADSQGDNEWGPSPKYPGAAADFRAQQQYGQQYGQPQYGQQQYAQPQYGQQQYAQPQYGQQQYAQPYYGQQSAQPQAAQPQYYQPQAAQAQPAQPQYYQPQAAQAQPAQPQYYQPQAAQSQDARPQYYQPGQTPAADVNNNSANWQ